MKQHKTLSFFFLSITTVVFHRSHYTTISKVGMHKIKYEVKNMKNMLVFALLCYAHCVMGCSLGENITSVSIQHST